MRFVMLSSCLAAVFILLVIIYCIFVWPISQTVVLIGAKKEERQWGRIFYECQWVGVEGAYDQWQISVLWCCCGHWETSGLYVWLPPPRPLPRSCALLTTCAVCPLPHTGLYFRKTVCHQPLDMCLNDISPVCLRECLCPRDDWMFVIDG